MDGCRPLYRTPHPVVALPYGTRSTRRVGRSARASPAARLTAVVVFPTPPFWFTIARVFATPTSESVPRGTPPYRHLLTCCRPVPRATLSTVQRVQSNFP